jgi:hypothetical protein
MELLESGCVRPRQACFITSVAIPPTPLAEFPTITSQRNAVDRVAEILDLNGPNSVFSCQWIQ